ncbi:hypothetical protein BGW38_005873 [Lunasporangiospora selenospora]|uniref:Uncharacterized protein n=1 Tax=Lunasporangiospora selenospora TaxID=979761 RepID=A0A9P6KHA4_9FUNG|nr:hypothetical protein BGW38_005873 [Lunasporangiospora selenospora]
MPDLVLLPSFFARWTISADDDEDPMAERTEQLPSPLLTSKEELCILVAQLQRKIALLEKSQFPLSELLTHKSNLILKDEYKGLYPKAFDKPEAFYKREFDPLTDEAYVKACINERLQELPNNPNMWYTAPPAIPNWDPAWKTEKQLDQQLAELQTHVALLTKPIDYQALVTMESFPDLWYRDDEGNINPIFQELSAEQCIDYVRESIRIHQSGVLAHFNEYREFLNDFSHRITEMRMDNALQAYCQSAQSKSANQQSDTVLPKPKEVDATQERSKEADASRSKSSGIATGQQKSKAAGTAKQRPKASGTIQRKPKAADTVQPMVVRTFQLKPKSGRDLQRIKRPKPSQVHQA